MTDLPLASLLDAIQPDGEALVAPAPDTWKQGRTTYGGLTTALMLETARRQQPDLPPLRSAMVNFTGPVGNAPRLQSWEIRRGRNVVMVGTQAESQGASAARAMFCFGRAQDSEIFVERPAPDAPPPEAVRPYLPEALGPMIPAFIRNFEMLMIEGALPMSGATRGYLRAWVRHRDPASRLGITSLVCIADILPPAVFPLYPRMAPNSSIQWLCNVMTEAPETDDGWWMAQSEVSAARDGYSSQVMRIWNRQGELVIDGMQSVLSFV